MGSCFWMNGGTFRLVRSYLIKETILFDVPLPYINGANYELKITPSATTTTSFNPIESFMAMLQ